MADRRHECLDKSRNLVEMNLKTKNRGGKRIFNFRFEVNLREEKSRRRMSYDKDGEV